MVPAGPGTYDYYDRFLGHERRYARGELAAKCRQAGLEPVDDLHLASLLYPAFWLVKQRNRRRFSHLAGHRARAARGGRHQADQGFGGRSCRLEAGGRPRSRRA